MPRAINDQPVTALDRAAAISAALVIVGLAVFLLVRNQPIADPRLFFVLRVVISFSAATLGAAIPGFLNVGWSGGGLAVRAGGALALFALTFVYTPNPATDYAPSPQQIEATSEERVSTSATRSQQQSAHLIKTWKADVAEGGIPLQIIWVIMPDGTAGYEVTSGARKERFEVTWTYANGVIYEKGPHSGFSSGAIEWVDDDHFVITIKNNIDPGSEGVKRYYSRL